MSYKPDLDKMNRKLKTLGQGKYWKMAEGNNKFRILPPLDGESEFYLEITQHYGFTDEGRGRAYPCLEAMKGKSCPVCILYRAANEHGEAELAKKIAPKTNYISNVVVRADNSIRIYPYSASMLKNFLGYVTDDEYGPEILDEKSGRDFTVTREGTGFATKYKDARISPKPSPIGIDDWEDKVFNLEGEVEFKSFKELVAEVEDQYGDYVDEFGVDFNSAFGKKKKAKSEEEDEDVDSEEDSEEEDEKPSRSKAGSKDSKRKSKADDSDDEEEDSESDSEESVEEDEDGEDSQPKRKSSKGKSKAVEEDEDEEVEEFLADDDEEEVIEDEDEKPKKKAKVKVKGKRK